MNPGPLTLARRLGLGNNWPEERVWPAWHLQPMAHKNGREGEDWFGRSRFCGVDEPNELARLGPPLSMKRSVDGVILSGRLAEAFGEGEARDMLAGPVLMDPTAQQLLTEPGLGDLTDVRVAGWHGNSAIVLLTDALLIQTLEEWSAQAVYSRV